jgi:hypothetical protein
VRPHSSNMCSNPCNCSLKIWPRTSQANLVNCLLGQQAGVKAETQLPRPQLLGDVARRHGLDGAAECPNNESLGGRGQVVHGVELPDRGVALYAPLRRRSKGEDALSHDVREWRGFGARGELRSIARVALRVRVDP